VSTSGVTTFNPTRDEIIYAALRKAGAYYQGGTPTAIQVTDAIFALNSMIKTWSNFGLMLWKETPLQLPLVAGTNSYYVAGEILGVHPDDLFIRDVNNYDWPLSLISRDNYANIPTKQDSGRPDMLFVALNVALDATGVVKTSPGYTIQVYYTPDQAYTLFYTADYLVQDFSSTADNPDFPVSWSDVLVYGLASSLADEYGLPLQERQFLTSKASTLLSAAISTNKAEHGDMRVQPRMRRVS
jgi:hypothetical protein